MRMGEGQRRRMQQQPRGVRQRLGRRIQRIADDGVADCGQVHPQLVRAAGHRRQFQPRAAAGQAPGDVPVGDGGLAVLQIHLLARAIRPVGGQRQADGAVIVDQLTPDDGGVALVDLARLEGHRQRPLGFGAAGEQHQAGGGLVQPVHHLGVGMAGLQPGEQAIGLGFAPAGHRQQPGGLVDDQQVVVDMEDQGVGRRMHGGQR